VLAVLAYFAITARTARNSLSARPIIN
jgi:hypothetical protein